MRISHKYKFVYISIPKTGSSSVRNLLDKYSDVSSDDSDWPSNFIHPNAKQIKAYFGIKGWNWDEYFKFTVVRHPISRMKSSIAYALQKGEQDYKSSIVHVKNNFSDDQTNISEDCLRQIKNVQYTDDFTSRNLNLYKKEISIKEYFNKYMTTQHAFVYDNSNNEFLLNTFIKLENLESGLQKVWKLLRLDNKDLLDIPKYNATEPLFQAMCWDRLTNMNTFDDITIKEFMRWFDEKFNQDFKFFKYKYSDLQRE